MPAEMQSYIPVDELVAQFGHDQLQRLVAFYGVEDVELRFHELRNEIRSRCFLNCGRNAETGERAISINVGHMARHWKCFEKGCGKGGNLVGLCDFVKPGESGGGRPRGKRFKEIAADIKAVLDGESRRVTATASGTDVEDSTARNCTKCERLNPDDACFCYDCGEKLPGDGKKRNESKLRVNESNANAAPTNIPLCRSDNERARALVELDKKFILPSQVAEMPPAAARYFRMRPWLTDELAKRWRMGYLPRDAGGDSSGGTMRDKIVYCYLDNDGRELTWFGRDPAFLEKHAKWKKSGDTKKEPQKFRFVKGFHRGVELFGQHRIAQASDETREKLMQLGLIVVEGPNDVMRLDAWDVPSVALCGHEVTREQATKIAEMAKRFANGIVTVLLDVNAEGENGMRRCLGYISQLAPVRLGWTSKMYGGKFAGREVESLKINEWSEIVESLEIRDGTL